MLISTKGRYALRMVIALAKLEKAVRMSEETYCGVRAVYTKAMEMTSEIRVVDTNK